jgi:branched-chain amino acid transport system ATP-binding protein
MLQVENITKSFGGLLALNKVSIFVKEGTIHGLIGPNGSGKTTLFNVISGIIKANGGRILFKDTKINDLKPNKVTKLGIARTFQNIRLFGEMSLLENVMVGRHCRTKAGFIHTILNSPLQRREEKKINLDATRYLEYVGLEEKKNIRATQLSYGEQRYLEIARALATDPDILMLDEPAAGLNHKETSVLKSIIKRIRDEGKTVFLIEHDMSLVMDICENITVLNFGEKIAEGNANSIQKDQKVIEAYLGGGKFARKDS